MASQRPAARADTLSRLMSVGFQSIAARLPGRHRAQADPPHDPTPVPTPRWDNIGLSVDQGIKSFVAVTSTIPEIKHVYAKSSGPNLHFLVTTDSAWDSIIDAVEERLFPLAKSGVLPPFDYDVRQEDETVEPGYQPVFPT